MDVTKQHYLDKKNPVCKKYMALLDRYDRQWDKIMSASKALREEAVITDETLYQEALDHYSTVMKEYQDMRKELNQLSREMAE